LISYWQHTEKTSALSDIFYISIGPKTSIKQRLYSSPYAYINIHTLTPCKSASVHEHRLVLENRE